MDSTAYSYVEVMAPRTFTICGVELLPFSLGHWMILDRIESPFLSTTVEAPFEDGIVHFFWFLLICGQSYEQNELMLNDPKILSDTMRVFESQICKIIKKDKDWNIYSKINRVKEYLEYFTKMPVFTDLSTPSIPSGIDWKQNLYVIMKNEYHYDRSEILNMNLRRIFYEWCSFAEKNGAIKVSNANEIKALEAIGVKV